MNIKQNITKLTDLSRNDSLSGFMGNLSQQHHNVYQIFYDFLKETKPKRIIEIGTALGGFTRFLKICTNDLKLNCKILSFDINHNSWYGQMNKEGIDVRVENIFNKDYSSVKKEVIDFIKTEGTTIVLCDGGWKTKEFDILSNYIKKGDFILAHDYCQDEKTFNEKIKNKIWNWLEITDKDIQESVNRNNLKPYKPEIFSQAVWVCKIKQL
jgi:hypothetical protein